MKYVAFSIYSQTGTGKTLAFLLPAFIHIKGQPVPLGQRGGPNVLVLAPTRELALQIAEEVKKYEYRGIKSVCVYGGGDRRQQMKVVTEGVEIIIATPGRLNDLVSEGEIRYPKKKVRFPTVNQNFVKVFCTCCVCFPLLSVRSRPAISRWSP